MLTLGGGETIMEGLIKKKRFENTLGYSKMLLIMPWCSLLPTRR